MHSLVIGLGACSQPLEQVAARKPAALTKSAAAEFVGVDAPHDEDMRARTALRCDRIIEADDGVDERNGV